MSHSNTRQLYLISLVLLQFKIKW